MFIIENIEDINNYPKYTILNRYYTISQKSIFQNNIFERDIFYYLVSKNNHIDTYINTSINKSLRPIYLITNLLTISIYKGNEKFDLSKLGTDYLINDIGMHYQYECTGSYSDNYVFVNEPRWPQEKYRTDISSLKRFKG